MRRNTLSLCCLNFCRLKLNRRIQMQCKDGFPVSLFLNHFLHSHCRENILVIESLFLPERSLRLILLLCDLKLHSSDQPISNIFGYNHMDLIKY